MFFFKVHIQYSDDKLIIKENAATCFHFGIQGNGNTLTDKQAYLSALQHMQTHTCKTLQSYGGQSYLVNEQQLRHWDRTPHYLWMSSFLSCHTEALWADQHQLRKINKMPCCRKHFSLNKLFITDLKSTEVTFSTMLCLLSVFHLLTERWKTCVWDRSWYSDQNQIPCVRTQPMWRTLAVWLAASCSN